MVCGLSELFCPGSDQTTIDDISHKSKAAYQVSTVPSYKVTVDCGGKLFVASAATLAAHSLYFANLLPDDWFNFSREGTTLFVDADPDAFGVLLAYMRQGFIAVDDIDTGVLALAKVLAMKKLLLAIKVRWYVNIGKGPVLFDDRDIVHAFNEVHGGINGAISSGLFPLFHKPDEENATKDLAVVVMSVDDIREENLLISVSVHNQLGDGRMAPPINCGLIGALNGLHAMGYRLHGEEIEHSLNEEQSTFSITLSRKRHAVVMRDSTATDILVPTKEEVERQKGRSNSIKQFVLYIKDTHDATEKIIAPAEFAGDANPYSESTIESDEVDGDDEMDFWLEKHNFVTRERELEADPLFAWYLKFLRGVRSRRDERLSPITCGIYSRQVERAAARMVVRSTAALADDEEDCREEVESAADAYEEEAYEEERHSAHSDFTLRAGPRMTRARTTPY